MPDTAPVSKQEVAKPATNTQPKKLEQAKPESKPEQPVANETAKAEVN